MDQSCSNPTRMKQARITLLKHQQNRPVRTVPQPKPIPRMGAPAGPATANTKLVG